MNVLMVGFELSPGGNEGKVIGEIERFDNMRLNNSAYLIATESAPDDVYGQLQPLLGQDDIVYVVTAANPWMGYGYEAMNDWLHKHLG